MSVPVVVSEELARDRNYTPVSGGVSISDDARVINLRMRDNTGRLLVETEADDGVAASITPNEVTAIETGIALTYGSNLSWFNVINDDFEDDVWVRFGSITASTSSTIAFKVKPGEVLDVGGQRMPSGITEVVLTTNPTKSASCRVGAGLA